MARRRRILLTLFALAILAASGCYWLWSVLTCEVPLPTVDGPEDPALLADLHGALILSDRSRELRILSLPERTERTLVLDEPSHAHTAIDQQGRLAYVVRRKLSYEVRLASIHGGDERVLVDARGELEILAGVALSATTGRLAFVSAIHEGAYRYSPRRLEIFDLDSGAQPREFEVAGCMRPRWMPDGRWLAVAADSGVMLLDAERGAEQPIALPGYPCPGPTGFPMLVDGSRTVDGVADAVVWKLDAPSAKPEPVTVPGKLYSLLGWTDAGLVLYEGLPTTGTVQQPLYAFLAGPCSRWTIKVAAADGRFATLVPYFGHGFAVWDPDS